MTIRYTRLKEGLTHLEDLPIDDFINKITNLDKLEASEKNDGAEAVFGLDNFGKLYLTRKLKGATNLIYDINDWYKSGGGPGFAAAQVALQQQLNNFKKIMAPGGAVEIEILFGEQPNAIKYGKNGRSFISFLRPVPGTNGEVMSKDDFNKLKSFMNEKTSTITIKMPTTNDGEDLKDVDTTVTWQFTYPQQLNTKQLKTELDDVIFPVVEKLKLWLGKNSGITAAGLELITNYDLITINLNVVPKEERSQIKIAREKAKNTLLTKFQLPIKADMLKHIMDKHQSSLGDDGMEGLVFTDPTTGEEFKLVDKEEFTTINMFNHMIRKRLAGPVKSADQDASLEARGGLFGVMRYRILSLLGIPELILGQKLNKVIAETPGKTGKEKSENMAKDFEQINFRDYKIKIQAIIKYTIAELKKNLIDFKQEHDKYELVLSSGKKIGYSDEVVRRTLLAFAELRQKLLDLQKQVDKAGNTAELLYALFKPRFEKQSEELTEHRLLKEDFDDGITALKSYLLNLEAVYILLRLMDKKTSHELANGGTLTKPVSYINKQGHRIFNPSKTLDQAEATFIKKHAGRILDSRKKLIHSGLSGHQNMLQNWHEVGQSLDILARRLDLDDEFHKDFRDVFARWDGASNGEKSSILNRLLTQLMGVDDKSPYLIRLRIAASHILSIDPVEINAKSNSKLLAKKLIHKIFPMSEDEAIANTSAMTTSTDIATNPVRLFGGKLIQRRKRTWMLDIPKRKDVKRRLRINRLSKLNNPK